MKIKNQVKETGATRKFFLQFEIKGFASEVLKSVGKKVTATIYKFSAKDFNNKLSNVSFLEEEPCPSPSLVGINVEKRMVGIIGMGRHSLKLRMFFNVPCVSFGILVSSWMKCLFVGNFLCPLSCCSLWFSWINFPSKPFYLIFMCVCFHFIIWRPIFHVICTHAYLYVPYPVLFFSFSS